MLTRCHNTQLNCYGQQRNLYVVFEKNVYSLGALVRTHGGVRSLI